VNDRFFPCEAKWRFPIRSGNSFNFMPVAAVRNIF
jgi:hypothetical protein